MSKFKNNIIGQVAAYFGAIVLLVLIFETVKPPPAPSQHQDQKKASMEVYEYLASVPLTQAQKEKVTEEGYEDAATFYMMCKFIPRAIREFLELDSLDAVEEALWALMTEEEREQVEKELALLRSHKEMPSTREGM